MLLYVGRFTEVKRAAAADRGLRARPARASPAARRSCIVGGFPGEWEGEHPLEAIRRTGARGRVPGRLARATTSCPTFLAASDVVVLPSVREQFGQVLVEGDGVRAAGDRRRRLGPGRHRRRTARRAGWSSPTTPSSLANALVHAVNCPAERRRRGERAAAEARERYSWPALAEDVAAVYDAARDGAALTH